MTHTDHPLDAEPIGLFERMCACWTAGDADGHGAGFTEECDYVSYDGTHARGRRDVVASTTAWFGGS